MTTTPDPADQPTPSKDGPVDDRVHDPLGLNPDSPGISAMTPIDDPTGGNAEPNEPA